MKKQGTVSIIVLVIVLLLVLLAAIPSQPVEAQDRDGGELFTIGLCLSQQQDRDGTPIIAGHWLDVITERVPIGSEIKITLSGYDNPSYVDFGIPLVREDTFILPPGFQYGWSKEPYELGSNQELLSVTILGETQTVVIPTVTEAFLLIEQGEVLPCPNPWPPVPQYYLSTYLPLIMH